MADGAAVVAAVYDAVAANDFEQVVRLVAEDFVFDLGATSRFAGRHEGRDAFFALQADLVAATGIENEVSRSTTSLTVRSCSRAVVDVTATPTRRSC